MTRALAPFPARNRSGWRFAVLSALVLAGLAILVSLGTWQLHRRAWKEALIDRITQRLADAPQELPAPASWPRLEREEMEFRRVRLRGEFLHDHEAFVYAVPSTLRSDVSGPLPTPPPLAGEGAAPAAGGGRHRPGYWVFTPARLENGPILFVNRGFVPEDRQNPDRRREGELAGAIAITGVMRWPEGRNLFTPADEPSRKLWFVRDPTAMAASMRLGAVAPFYIEQEAPVPPGGLPSPGRITANLPDNHLQYAITWYGLAAVLAVMFARFAWTQWPGSGELQIRRTSR